MVAMSIAFATPMSAQVVYDKGTDSLTIFGNTDNLQLALVQRAFKENHVGTIYMKGNGGLFYTGLALGRAIRESGARVIIPTGTECISACAFAAIASEEVHVDGALLFHRPYMQLVPTNATIEEISGYTGGGYLDGAMYIVEMGYPLSWVKQMIVSTSPCLFIKVVDEAQLQDFKEGRGSFMIKDDRCLPQVPVTPSKDSGYGPGYVPNVQ